MDRAAAGEHYRRGVVLSQDARITEAIQQYYAAAQADPTWALPRLNLGVAFLNKGNPAQAASELQQGLQLANSDDEKAVFLSSLGQAYHKLGDLEAAIDCYEKSLTHEDVPSTWVELALAWHNLGQNDKAIACLERYLENPVEELYPTAQVRALLDSYMAHTPKKRDQTFLIVLVTIGVVVLLLLGYFGTRNMLWTSP